MTSEKLHLEESLALILTAGLLWYLAACVWIPVARPHLPPLESLWFLAYAAAALLAIPTFIFGLVLLNNVAEKRGALPLILALGIPAAVAFPLLGVAVIGGTLRHKLFRKR